ncbi:MAG: helix-turn-helix domain-containing protein [Candidatus Cloacimonetes bacterium]|nr:helix-turn-helix domain-containing protein [Candidatus Cloacimonadota bacterium]
MRVISSPIGKVIPIVDIAKAIDYERNKLHHYLNQYYELFEGTVVTQRVTTVQDNRGTEQTRDYDVKALNVYGVMMLLAKLDYTRIKDPDKRDAVLRFQKWAMRTLGDAAKKSNSFQDILAAPPADPNGSYLSLNEAAEYLGVSTRTIRRHIRKGIIKPCHDFTSTGSYKYAIPFDQLTTHDSRLTTHDSRLTIIDSHNKIGG